MDESEVHWDLTHSDDEM